MKIISLDVLSVCQCPSTQNMYHFVKYYQLYQKCRLEAELHAGRYLARQSSQGSGAVQYSLNLFHLTHFCMTLYSPFMHSTLPGQAHVPSSLTHHVERCRARHTNMDHFYSTTIFHAHTARCHYYPPSPASKQSSDADGNFFVHTIVRCHRCTIAKFCSKPKISAEAGSFILF